MPRPHVMVRHSLDLMNTVIDLDVESTQEGLAFLLIDTNRTADANPVANFELKVRGTLLLLEVHDWRQINADKATAEPIVLYDLSDLHAEPLPAPKPGVFLSIDGGVVHGVTSNVPGIEIRAFDHDLLEEQEERDPPGEIIYDVDEVAVAELDWAKYRREEVGQ